MYCEIYLFDAPYHIDRAFDYACAPGVELGSVVRVPFGKANKLRLGVVTRLKDNSSGADNIKPVHSVVSYSATTSAPSSVRSQIKREIVLFSALRFQLINTLKYVHSLGATSSVSPVHLTTG